MIVSGTCYPRADWSIERGFAIGRLVAAAQHLHASFGMPPDNTVEGNCGSSTVTAVLTNTSTGALKVVTSYYVYAPSVEQHWFVDEYSVHGSYLHEFNFSGFNASNSWVAAPQTYTTSYANQGGDVQVTLGSYAALADGDICYSGGPIDWF